jgi:hypothetical protein
MAQLTATRIFGGLRGLFSALDSTDDALLKNLMTRHKVVAQITDGGTAGTAQTETPVWENTTGNNMRVVTAKLIAPVTGAASATDTVTVTVTKRDAAGGSAAVVATYTSNVAGTGFTAFVPEALTNTVANVIVPTGYTLTVLASKANSGVAIAAATSQAVVEIVLEPSD